VAALRAKPIVLPTSPDTTRFAIIGINAIISENKILDSPISTAWLAPAKRPPNVPAFNMVFRLPALMSVSIWLITA
jgi:hypothetical protein